MMVLNDEARIYGIDGAVINAGANGYPEINIIGGNNHARIRSSTTIIINRISNNTIITH
jgi:hypothetical protein